jgi:hypothetical protein
MQHPSGPFFLLVEHLGLSLVFFGVLMEGIEVISDVFYKEFHKKFERKFKLIGFFGWAILVLGLSLEFIESASLDAKLADTEFKSRQLESTNLTLRAEVASLQSRVEWRKLTSEQAAKITADLKLALEKNPITMAKAAVTIGVESTDTEAVWYARSLSAAIKAGGIKCDLVEGLYTYPKEAPGPYVGVGGFGRFGSPQAGTILYILRLAGINVIGGETHELELNAVLIRIGHKPEK